MTDFIRGFLGTISKNSARGENDFSTFFTEASSRDKAKLIRRVLRRANEEQRRQMSHRSGV